MVVLDKADKELKKRLHNRNRSRSKTPEEEAYLSRRKLYAEEANERFVEAAKKGKEPTKYSRQTTFVRAPWESKEGGEQDGSL